MKKIFAIVLAVLMIFDVADAKKISGMWRLDGTSSPELKNFRLMTDAWQNDPCGHEPTRQGLDSLNASASGQPSVAALKTLYEKIRAIKPDAEIFLVDLRQESHGYANSLPVSWYFEHNTANAGKNSAEVESDERTRLKNLRGVDTTFEPLGNADKKSLKPIRFIPRVMQTERAAAEEIGFHYVRFAAADMQYPAPEVVEDFKNFVATLPPNAWLHFHCQAGQGRTTTFLVMYDRLKNPDVSIEDICRRQYLLGGPNLLLEPEGDDWYAKVARDRAKKIRDFK